MKLLVVFIVLFVVFGTLERLFPLKKNQKCFRFGWLTDVSHFFINHFLVNVGTYIVAVLLYIMFHGAISPTVQLAVRSQPTWLQFIEAFFIAQLAFYIVHRLAHTIPWLWKFHQKFGSKAPSFQDGFVL